MKTLNALNLKNDYSNVLQFQVTRSRTWGYTVCIKDQWTDKKVAYSGGYGYNKDAALLKDFVFNHYESNPYIKTFCEMLDAGFIGSMWQHLEQKDFEQFFSFLNKKISVKEMQGGKYPILRISILGDLMTAEEFEEFKKTFINNNIKRYNEVIERYFKN